MARRSEEVEQSLFITWTHRKEVRALMPALRWLHHSPNGGRRDGFTGAQMTALGVKRGWPDLVLPASNGKHPGLVIEMKSDTGRATPEQAEWLAHFVAQGWHTDICRSAQEARETVCNYFSISPDTAPALG